MLDGHKECLDLTGFNLGKLIDYSTSNNPRTRMSNEECGEME